MDKILSGLIDYLVSQGPAGLAIAALGYVAFRVWQENKLLQTQLNALQEKRVVEAREIISAMTANTSALNTLTQVLSQRRD